MSTPPLDTAGLCRHALQEAEEKNMKSAISALIQFPNDSFFSADPHMWLDKGAERPDFRESICHMIRQMQFDRTMMSFVRQTHAEDRFRGPIFCICLPCTALPGIQLHYRHPSSKTDRKISDV